MPAPTAEPHLYRTMPVDPSGKRSVKPTTPPTGKRPPRTTRPASGRKSSGKPPGAATDDHNPRAVRLQRALAAAGFGSRRQCEELILEGRVEVDGQTVDKLGTTVDPSHAKIFVDGTPLKPHRLVYFIVNKPVGVVTTNADPQGRPRVIDLVPPDERVFPVGRLDRASEGLILLTNDGDLAQRLAHPRFEVPKVYRVTVAGNVTAEALREMRHGIYIAEGLVRVEGAKVLKAKSKSTEMEITLKEGKNREIRRILARLGHKVQTLKRIAMGPLRMGELPTGAYRKLSPEELKKLKRTGETEHGEDTAEGTPAVKPRAGKLPGSKSGGKPPRERKSLDDARPRPTSRADRKPGLKPRPLPVAGGDDAFSGKRESSAPPSFPPTGNRGGVVIGGDEPERRPKPNRSQDRPVDENTLVIRPRRKGKKPPLPPEDEASPRTLPPVRPANRPKRGKPVARAAQREEAADAPPRSERPAVPGKRGGGKRVAQGKRSAAPDRLAAGKRSGTAKRVTPGKRPAPGKRPGLGKRAAAGQRPDVSKRPDFSKRPNFGKRPPARKPPGGGQNRKRPGGDDNE